MYCRNCGRETGNNSTYCPVCGVSTGANHQQAPTRQPIINVINNTPGYIHKKNGPRSGSASSWVVLAHTVSMSARQELELYRH